MTWRNWLDGLRHSITSCPRARRGRKPRLRTVSLLNQQVAAAGLAWQAESLEDRALLSAFNESGATLTLDISTASASVAITAGASSYTFTLTGDTWSGSDSANVTGNGTNTLTVTSAGLTAFNTINLGDSASGIAVNFNDSGANSYSDDVNVTLDDAGAGTITFSGATPFSGTSDLSVSTTRNIVVNSGASVTAVDGSLTLEANQQVTPTTGNFVGISVNNATIEVTGNGLLSLSGRGGNSVSNNDGVRILGGGAVKGGSNSITVTGTGGASGSSGNDGVVVTGTNSRITSSGGAVLVEGTGGGTGGSSDDRGVVVDSAGVITSSGTASTATVTVKGFGGNTGGTSGSGEFGVYITGANSQITSSGGAVLVEGTGGGSGSGINNHGVVVDSFGFITSAGTASTATVTVKGFGGLSTGNSNFGVRVTGSNARITSGGGAVLVQGTGGGTGSSGQNRGVLVENAGAITSAGTAGTATVTVKGTGGNSGGSGSFNTGVLVLGTNSRITSSGGAVLVEGVGTSNTEAVRLQSSGAITSGSNAAITVSADSVNILADSSGINSGSGSTTIQPRTIGTLIDLGGADVLTGIPLTLGLTDEELDLITAGAVQIGSSSSGAITFQESITRAANTNINLTTGANNNIAFGTFSLNAGSGGDVTLTTSGTGAITTGDNTGTDITGDDISVNAGSNGIGTTTNFVRLAGATVTASTSGNGGINLVEADSVTIAAGGLNAGAGTITLGGGTFSLGGSNRINNASDVNLSGGATLALGTNAETIDQLLLINGSVTGSGAGTLTGTSTFDVRSGSVSAILAGSGVALTKSTGGTVTLSGANTYTGATTINAGTLQVNGSLASGSAVTVNNTGTLAGSGTVNGTVSVASGGTVAPGNSPGVLSTGSYSQPSGATLTIEIDGPAGAGAVNGHDQLSVTGTVTLGGTLTLDLTDLTSGEVSDGQRFIIIANNGTSDAVSGTFNGLADGAVVSSNFGGSGKTARITYFGGDGNDVAIVVDEAAPVVAVPNDGNANSIEVQIAGDTVQVIADGVVIDSRPLDGLTSLEVTGVAGQTDTFEVDLTANSGLANLTTITFTGNGDAADKVIANGAAGGSDVVLVFDGADSNKGTIQFNGGLIVEFDGIGNNTIALMGTDDLTITFGDGAADIVFADHATANTSQVSGTGFVTTTFTDPASSLTINLGANGDTITFTDLSETFNPTNGVTLNGGAGADVITFVDLGDAFGHGTTGALTVAAAGGADSVDFDGATSLASLSLTAETITQSAALTVSGTTSLTAGAGDITLTTATNDFQGVVNASGANIDLTDAGSIQLGTISATTLDVVANGAGTITQDATSITVTGAASFTATGNDITLTDADNNFGGAVSANGANIDLTDANSIQLGTISATTLDVVANGAGTITQDTTSITVTGASSFTATGDDITLTDANNNFTGAVSATGANIDLTDAGSIQLGTISATTLDVVANGAGTITQNAGGLTVTGASSFTATGDDITLTTATNNFGGAVSATGDDVDLTDAGSIQLGTISATTLDVVANGAGTITQDATSITVTGASSFTATGDDITLTDADNNFGGAVSATGDDVDLTDANSIQLGTISATTLDVVANGAGTITQDTTSITVTGASSFTATGDDITLTDANNNFTGAVSATGDDVDLTDAGSIQLGTISATTLDVVANGAGTITQDATSITVTGASSFTATGDDITLTDADNNFGGAVSATGDDVDLTDVGSIQLGTISATTLDVVANGAGTITQNAGGLTVTGASSFTATGDDIALTTASNNFGGAVSATGDDVDLTDAGSIQLGTISATTLDVVANGAGTITQDATSITVTGASSFTATGNDITLTDTDNNFNSVALDGAVVSVSDTNAIDIASATATTSLTISAGGAITDSGNISVTNNASFSGTSVLLGGAETTNFGSLTFSSAGSVSISEDSATDLSGTSTAGSLSLTSAGAITDANTASTTVTNNASFNGVSITLGDQAGDTFNAGTLTFVSTGGNVEITENSDTILTGTNTVSNNDDLTLTSSGTITDAAGTSLTVTGTGGAATFSGTSITLGDDGGDTTNFGTLTVTSAGAVSISEDTNTVFAGSSTAGSLSINTTGDISDGTGGDISVTGNASFTASGTITLGNDPGNDTNFGSISLSGTTVSVSEDSSATFATVSVTTLTYTANGAIDDSTTGDVSVTGAASLTATGSTITLGNDAGNDTNFGSISLSGTTVSVSEDSAATFVTVSVTALTYIANGAIDDSTTGDVSVTGAASLTATGSTITLGNDAGNDTNFGSLTFNAGGAVSISEDSAMTVSGASTAGAGLTLISADDVTLDATINVTGATSITAGTTTGGIDVNAKLTGSTTILLDAADEITIDADIDPTTVTLQADDDITINAAVVAENLITVSAGQDGSGSVILSGTGSLLADNAGNTADITISTGGTTGSVTLTGTTTADDTVTVTAAGSINGAGLVTATTIDLNAGSGIGDTTALELAGSTITADTTNGAIDLDNALGTAVSATSLTTGSGSVRLDQSGGGALTTGTVTATTSATLTNSAGAVALDGSVTADSLVANASGTVTDGANGDLAITSNASITGSSITLGNDAGNSTNFGSLTFNSAAGAVSITEDSTTQLTGTNTADSLTLVSAGAVTDAAGTSVTIDNGNASITGTSISLADNGGDTLSVSGTASFDGGAGAITVAAAGAVNFGSLTFNTTGGAVSITEDSTTQLTGTNTADSLTLTSSGTVMDATGTSVTIDNGNASITGTSISLADNGGDTLSVSGTASFDGGAGAITVAAAGAVNFGSLTFNTTGGAVSITEDSTTQLTGTNTADSLTLVSAGAVTDATGTSVTIDNGNASITGTSISLADNGGDTLSVSGTASFDGGAGAITVASAGAVNFGSLTFNTTGGAVSITEDSATQLTGTNTGDSLTLVSSGAVTDATGTSVTIDNGNASITGTSISLADNGGDTLSVSGTASFNGGAGAITVAAAGSVNFGSLTFNTTGGAVSITEDSATQLTGTNTADSLTLTSSGAVTDATGTSVTIDNGNASITGTSISLADNADTLSVSGNATLTATAGSIAVAAAGTVNFGSLDAGATTTVTISENSTMNLNVASGTIVTLTSETGAIVDNNAGANNVSATSAALSAVTGIGSGAALETTVTTLAFSNTTSGSVEISNTGALTIGSVGALTTSSNAGGAVVLQATSPVTFAVNTSSAGNLTAQAIESASTNTDNITVNAAVTVQSTGGDVLFEAGDRIIISNTATVQATAAGGDITFDSGFGDTDGDGAMTLDGAVSANTTNGVVTLDLNAQQGATQAGTGAITGNGLRLLSTGASGSFSLTSASNDVNTIAANTAGAISFTDSDGLTVGTVTTVGITTTNDSVTLDTGAAITIDDNISIGSGTLTLDSAAGVTQNASDNITAANLLLLGAGTFNINNAGNDVDVLAADLNAGTITFQDADNLEIGTVGATNGIATGDPAAGGAVTITATSGTITVNQAISTATGTGGGISISGAVVLNATVTAAGGTVTLNGANNGAFDLDINADLVSSASISLTAPRDILVGALVQTTGAGSDITLTADSETTPDGIGGVQIEAAGQVDSADAATISGSDLFADAGGTESVQVDADGTNNQILADGTITIFSGPNAPAAADIEINGAIESTGAGTTIAIDAFQDVLFGVNGDVTRSDAGASGLIHVFADQFDGTSTGGVVTMADGTVINGGGGEIEVVADGNLTVGRIITTDLINALSTSGSIVDGGDTGGADFVADSLAISGETGVGTDADALETQLGTLAGRTESGDFHISNTGALTLDNVDLTAAIDALLGGISPVAGVAIEDAGNDDSGNDNITLVATGALTLNSTVDNNDGGSITLTSSGAAATNDLSINDDVSATGGNGTITLNAGDSILQGATASVTAAGSGAIDYNAGTGTTTGVITMADGAEAVTTSGVITMDADGNITLGRLSTFNATTSAVTINSATGGVIDGGDTDGEDISAMVGRVVINAVTGVGSSGAIETEAGSLDIDNSTSGDIQINETSAVTLFDVQQATAGNITITAGGTITVDNAGAVTNAVSTVGAGTIFLDANGASSNIAVNDGIQSAAGSITLNADNDITMDAPGDITSASGMIQITADADSTTIGAITMTDGAVVNAGSNVITLSAGGNVTLGSLTTTSASNSAITVTSTNGSVLDGGDTHVDVVAASGRAVITAFGAITTGIGGANAIETTLASLDASVTASGIINLVESDAITLFDVDTANGSITISAGGTITATDVASLTSNDANDISLTATSGNILVALVTAGTTAADVTLNAAGSIEETANDAGADIIGDDLRLLASTGIGSLEKIEINGIDLAATTATGDISLNDTTGGLVIATIGGTVGVSITTGGAGDVIDISTNSPLTVSSAVSNAGGDDITLAANGGAGTDDLAINADVTASGGNGDIFLYAGDSITLNGGGTADVTATGTGTILLSAGTNYNNGGGLTNGTNAGSITMTSGTTITSQDGDITLRAPGNVAVSIVNADSNASGGIGDVLIIADYDGVATGLANNAGAITDSLTGEAVNITADLLTLRAATGIGSADDIETTVNTLNAINTTSGNIQINETNAVTVTQATQNTAGNISIVAAGTITVDSAGSPVNAVSAAGTGTIALDANGAASDIVLNDGILSVSGSITLTADNDVTTDANGDITSTSGNLTVTADVLAGNNGGVIFMADGALWNAGSGAIDLDSDGNITLGGLQTTSALTTAVTIDTTSGAVIDGGDAHVDIVADSGTVTINAVTGVGSANAIDTTINFLSLTNSTSGNVDINETNSININRITQSAAPGFVNVDANGTITVVDAQTGISALNGLVTLDANGTASNVAINHTVTTTGGNVLIDADNNITFDATSSISSTTGNVVLTADADNGGANSGAITMTDGSFVNAGTGTITATADGDITVSRFVTTNNTVNAILITSIEGGLVDGGDTGGPDIVANSASARTTITTATGIGAATGFGADPAIETQVTTLDASTTAAGNIDIDETDAITLLDVDTFNGAIQVDAGNTLTAVDVSSANTSNDANDITLSTAAGNIEVGLIQAGAAGDVFLISAAAITDGDAGTDIFADDLVMTAMNGDIAGSGDRLETDIDNVEAIASGGVYLTNIGNLVVGDASVMFGITAGDTVRIVNTTGTLRINERITAIGSLVALEAAGILSNLDDAGTPDSDIVSGTTALRSTAGIGQMGDVLEVTTGTLAFSNTTSGDVFIRDTAGGLFIDNVDGLTQSTNTATGAISVATTAGQLTVDHNVTASSGVIILTAQDSTVGNENVVISTGTTVQSVTSNVTLNGGDAVTLQHDSAVITPATLFINTDEGNADIGGGFVTVNGDISALNTIITGDSDNDTFTIQPNDQVVDDDNVTTMTIDGEEGSDTYLIYMGALDGGATDVSIEDSGTNETDSATVFATAADEDINVLNTVQDITQVQTGGFVDNMTISEFVNYDQNLERLEVRGQDGTDAFHTNPSQTTFISIHGGNPQFGDALVSPPLTGDLTLITPPPVGDTIDFQPFDHRFNVLGRTIYTAQVQSGQPTALNPFQGVSLRNVESVPLTPQPPGSAVTDPPNERHFDFNHIDNEGDVSPTETDLFTYESVTEETLFGGLVDDGMGGMIPRDYGFVVADPNMSALESELDTSPLTTQMDDLIRDGVTSTETENFRAVVANGWYLVSVKVTNVLNFQVRDGDNPTDILATNVSFTGHGEVNFVLLVTDGTMDLLLETGGTSGTRWRVDGIDIQPGVILTFGSPDPGFLAADGATIDNFTGYEAEPGSIVTIVAGIDADGDDIVDRSIEITSPDIDPDLDGVQVLVDGSGEFTYSLRRPTAVGTGLISFVQFDGRETGLLVLDYVRVSSRRFDFNTGVSVTQAPINSSPVVPNVAEIGGFIGVKPTDNFSQSFLGYGWDRLVDSTVNSGTTGFQANMRRDAHLGNANEGNSRFSAQIENGTYSVTATLGNPNGNAETIQILAEGVMVVSNVSVYSNNDRTETFVVTVSDGQLDLDFSSTKGTVWGIKGLTIIPSAMATGVTITTALGSVAGNGTTQDTISGTGPANSLITVSSTLGTIVTADADSKMVGTQVLTNGGGNWSFLLQRPAFGGTPTISATSVTGAGTVSSNGVVTYLGGSGGGENGSFFDFGSGTAQSGFTPVAANTAYTAGAGYGWTAGPQDQTDRGTLSGTNFSGLLGDAILGNVAGTFRTDLTTGAMYDVTVIFGAGTNMNVTVTNGSVISGLANVTGVSVPAGSFTHRSFVAQADNGRIDLQFATPSTTGSPWQVAGLIFRPLPLGTVTVSAPLGSATADGVTVDTFSVTGLEVGRTYTFSATAGTITNADQDSRFSGVQIVAAATTANVTLVRPATAQTVTVTVADVAGFERNTASRVYTVETVRRFDFNTLVSPTAGGFTGTSNGLWTAGATHGWVNKAPNTYDRTTTLGTVTTTNLYRDGVVGNEVRFRIAVDSAQTYDLQVYTGDRLLTTQVQIITEAGTVINGPILTATNYAAIALSNLTDVNGDGYLDLFFQKGPNGFQPLVSGIDIATDGNLPAAAPQMATITGSGSATVSLGQVQTIVSAAIDRFAQAGLSDAALAHLRTVTVEVRDLGGKTLGLGSLNAIVLDDDAAGLGWFVDETPDSDSEFDIELAATVRSASEGVAAARYDLLSTVMHELGHTLGLSDLSPSVQPQSLMNGELSPGLRRLADVDSVFAANGWIEDNR